MSDELTARVDDEVARFLDTARERARHVVHQHRATLDRLTDALLDRETLTDDDLARAAGACRSVPIPAAAPAPAPAHRMSPRPRPP